MSTGTLDRPLLGVMPTPPPPVHLGPTWEETPDWVEGSDEPRYVLPELTLGWQIQAWVEGVPELGIEANILSDETDALGLPKPFKFTQEQLRFVLWMYAIDDVGRFAYREIVLQRLKGWGKDPIAAVIAAVEFVGPCRFSGWADKDLPHLGLVEGDPVAQGNPRAWVQIAATSKMQTKNTMTMFPGLFSKECIAKHAIDIGKEVIYAYHGKRRIEAVTSSPATLEGARSTFVIKNETHHWKLANDGHAMADVIERNVTKAKDGSSRWMSITNAYEPSEDSVAQREREAYDDEASGIAISTGMMYDSLEAAPDAFINPPPIDTGEVDEDGRALKREPTEDEIRKYIAAVVDAVRGDSWWLVVDVIVNSIINRKNPVSRSRRFYYNQIVAAEDAWCHPSAIRAAIDPLVTDQRRMADDDTLRAGWIVSPADPIAMFFDGSKSEDSTGLVGCRLSDGYVFTIGIWQRPRGERGEGWLAPRAHVDARVHEAHKRFTVHAFFGDPSHAQDDESGERYWDDLMDSWHRTYKDGYKLMAVKDGPNSHSIMWDMTSPARHAQFVAAAERFITDIERKNDIEEFDPSFLIDGHPALVNHLQNAKKYPVPGIGVSLFKGAREFTKKIDLAVCAVGARMVRRLLLNTEKPEEEERSGIIW